MASVLRLRSISDPTLGESGAGSVTLTLASIVAGSSVIGPDTDLDYAGLPAASGNWNLVVGNAAGNAFAKVDVSATVRSLLSAADGAGLRAVLGTGTADNTTYLRGDGTWQPLSGIVTTDASLLTSGTLADERLSANVPLLDAANVFTAAQTLAADTKLGGSTSSDILLRRASTLNGFARLNAYNGDVSGWAILSAGYLHGGTDSILWGGGGTGRWAALNNSATGFVGVSVSDLRLYGSGTTQDLTLDRPVARTLQVGGLGTNGSAGGLSFAGPSSTGTLRDVGLIQGGFSDSTDATRVGYLSFGAYYTTTLQTGLTIKANANDGTARVLVSPASNYTSILGGIDFDSSDPGKTGVQYYGGNLQFFLNNVCRFNLSTLKDFRIPSDHCFGWASQADNFARADTALARNAAGVVEVNNGTAGQYRDLILRKLEATGTATIASSASADSLTLYGQIGTYALRVKQTVGNATVALIDSAGNFSTTGTVTVSTGFRADTYNAYMGVLNGQRFVFTSTGIDAYGSAVTDNVLRLQNAASQTADTFQLWGVSSTSTQRVQAAINSSWSDSTDATRTGQLSLAAYYTGTLQEGLRIVAQSGGTPAVTVFSRPRVDHGSMPIWDFYAGGTYKGSVGITVYGNDVVLASPANSMVLRQLGGGFYFGDSGANAIMVLTNAGALTVNSTVKTLSTVVASLPSAATAGAGARAFVTDATATTFASAVTGGGANAVPVYSDGSAWYIG